MFEVWKEIRSSPTTLDLNDVEADIHNERHGPANENEQKQKSTGTAPTVDILP